MGLGTWVKGFLGIRRSVHVGDENDDFNLYKRDLLKCMQVIDAMETGQIQYQNVLFCDRVKRIGLIIYLAGPSIQKVSVELIPPMITIYDNDGQYGIDVKVAALSVLSSMMTQSSENQQRAYEMDLHMALLDDLDQKLVQFKNFNFRPHFWHYAVLPDHLISAISDIERTSES